MGLRLPLIFYTQAAFLPRMYHTLIPLSIPLYPYFENALK